MLVEILQAVPRDLEDLSIPHAAGTSRLARAASKALRDVRARVLPSDLSLFGRPQKVNPPARRLSLLPSHHECRTRFQAEPAPDALGREIRQVLHQKIPISPGL